MRIDRKRLEQFIDELGKIGETPRGGLTRLALTDDDRRGRDWMVARMREAGLRVTVDQMGNIFGERAGAERLPPVLMGSHVDSVPTGGKYDGQLGVLCGLETIRALNDHKVRTRHPVTLVIFTNEEGARFQPRSEEQRLNSSHMSISYAVFCLKKKKKKLYLSLFVIKKKKNINKTN